MQYHGSERRSRPLKLGFLGGGRNSAVGYTHYVASRLDGEFNVVAGCFSQSSEVNQATAAQFGVTQDRLYCSWDALLDGEREKLDAVCILTPTPCHAEMTTAALEAGFNVISEKAMATSLNEAQLIRETVRRTGKTFTMTFNYTGYPMVREAKAMIADGRIGKIQQIYCEMPQESFALASKRPQPWRERDYEIPCVSLDLGVHVHHLVDYLSGGRKYERFQSVEGAFGKIPKVVDTVSVIAHYEGQLFVSLMWGKANLGCRNGLKIRVFGEKGALEWCQADAERLLFCDDQGELKILDRGSQGLIEADAPRYNRFKVGHPAGFIEAFANLYADFATVLAQPDATQLPEYGVDVALQGIEALDQIHRKAN
jgi:predicted dehydrogenase